jgi:hypothetical protein
LIDARNVPLGANTAAIVALAGLDVVACGALASLGCANAGKTALDTRKDANVVNTPLCRFMIESFFVVDGV